MLFRLYLGHGFYVQVYNIHVKYDVYIYNMLFQCLISCLVFDLRTMFGSLLNGRLKIIYTPSDWLSFIQFLRLFMHIDSFQRHVFATVHHRIRYKKTFATYRRIVVIQFFHQMTHPRINSLRVASCIQN